MSRTCHLHSLATQLLLLALLYQPQGEWMQLIFWRKYILCQSVRVILKEHHDNLKKIWIFEFAVLSFEDGVNWKSISSANLVSYLLKLSHQNYSARCQEARPRNKWNVHRTLFKFHISLLSLLHLNNLHMFEGSRVIIPGPVHQASVFIAWHNCNKFGANPRFW